MTAVSVYRLAAWDTPFWVGPNRSAGRFNRAGSGPTQYWCLHPATAWAELLRREGIRDEVGLSGLRHRVWTARIDLDDCVDVGFDTGGRHGIAPDDLVADDWAACQAWAETVRGPHPGVVVPSAALPGTSNLVLFGARVAAPLLLVPVDPVVDVPAAHVAERATALASLLPMVRFRGEPHAGLEAWRAGEPLRFREPAVA